MKVFQLKAARAVLNLSVRDIGSYIGVSGTAVSMWESKDIDLDINTSEQNINTSNTHTSISKTHINISTRI